MAKEVAQPGFTIAGWGSALPERKVHNDEVAAAIAAGNPDYEGRPTDDAWIRKSTGIIERFIANPDEGEFTGSLAAAAGRIALEGSGFEPESIQMLVLATTTPDERMPATAPNVQEMLGLDNAFAYDLNAACSGFVYALASAESYMARHRLDRVMVIGAETLSSITNPADRTTAALFGDGAGAFVLEATDEDRGLIGVSLRSRGNKDMLYCEHDSTIRMVNGRPVFEAGIDYMVETSLDAMAKAKVTPDEVDLVVPHQANIRMMTAIVDKLGIPQDKMAVTIGHTGNTSAASIPVAFDERLRTTELATGNIILMTAAGAGMTGGSLVIKV